MEVNEKNFNGVILEKLKKNFVQNKVLDML